MPTSEKPLCPLDHLGYHWENRHGDWCAVHAHGDYLWVDDDGVNFDTDDNYSDIVRRIDHPLAVVLAVIAWHSAGHPLQS